MRCPVRAHRRPGRRGSCSPSATGGCWRPVPGDGTDRGSRCLRRPAVHDAGLGPGPRARRAAAGDDRAAPWPPWRRSPAVDARGLGLEALGRVGLDAQLGYFEHLYEDGAPRQCARRAGGGSGLAARARARGRTAHSVLGRCADRQHDVRTRPRGRRSARLGACLAGKSRGRPRLFPVRPAAVVGGLRRSVATRVPEPRGDRGPLRTALRAHLAGTSTTTSATAPCSRR